MPDMGAGTTLYAFYDDVASADFTPQVPNAAVVKKILLAEQSANDIWVVRTNGQEVGRFVDTSGSKQNVLQAITSSATEGYDVFDYCYDALGLALTYPVPEGKHLVVQSEGGATADITIVYEEFADSALNPGMYNYPGGKKFLAPVWFYLTAKPALPGEYSFDTEVGLDFVPTLFVKESFPVGWTARILDLFLQGAGVNTYASSSDTFSITEYVAAVRSGQRLFTRDAAAGIPLVGTPAAAGSGNVVLGELTSPYSTFTEVNTGKMPQLDAPIHYRPGYVCDWRLAVDGDLTTGADYSTAVQLAIVEYTGA